MKILILGGFGYIGSTLTKFLLDNTEHKITVIDTLEFGVDQMFFYDTLNHDRIQFIKGDMSNLRLTYDLIKKHDVVVDLASLTLPNSAKEPGEAMFINQTMAEIIGDCCKKLGKRMIFMSTCSNYGKSSKLIDEDGELLPVSIYAISKVNAEKYLLNNVPNVTILRSATAYGVGAGRTRWDVLFNDFVKTGILKGKIEIFQPDAHRPICHVADISNAVHLTINNPATGSCIYNVGTSAQNYTKGALAKIVGELTGAEITFIEKDDTRDYKVNFEKIHKDLGFTAKNTPQSVFESLCSQLSNENGLWGAHQ